MPQQITFTCVLPNGLHARPASHVENVCKVFAAKIDWFNTRTQAKGDAKSVLSLISTNTLQGDQCHLLIDGEDEQQAFNRLNDYLEKEFPFCDEALAKVDDELEPLPRSLSNLNPHIIRAKSVCGGTAKGRLHLIGSFDLDKIDDFPTALSIWEEGHRIQNAVNNLNKLIALQINSVTDTSKEILSAHQAILTDPAFNEQLQTHIDQGQSAGKAIIATAAYFSKQFRTSGSEYLRERELDIRDICFQLLQKIYGEEKFPSEQKIEQPVICVAEELTPSQFIALDKKYLKGLLLKAGGTTSHTVILARSFNIPTLVGIETDGLSPYLGQEVYIDGALGLIAYDVSAQVERYYRFESELQRALCKKQREFVDVTGMTADGVKVEVAANIAHSIEAKTAFSNGAESIGLFRTEMLYMDRTDEPTEDELYNTFCQALESAQNRSIIIRTFDIGGDKPVKYLNIPAENNPFLGYRAVRIYQEFLTLFRTQLRAILRASAHGKLKIMIPMISSLEEILWIKEELANIKHQLRTEKIPFDEKIPLGIMLEVPSVIFIIDQCCEEVDFFSIGSNDLTQYLLAVDRDNSKVTKHYNSLNPAFLRSLDDIVQKVHHYGKWIGICGELAAKGSVLPLLIGLGLDELSMSSSHVLTTKARLAKLNRSECRLLLNKAMDCRTALEVEHLLAQFRMSQGDVPMISTDCITVNSDWQSKEEIIKGMTDNLLVAERCRYPRSLAADIWAREDVFSTALGYGFAIPHTKSEHIEQSTISVCKLAQPVIWGEENVSFVIMLTLNKHAAGDQHMRIFSKLARRIMHEDFRLQVTGAQSAVEIERILKRELAI
ncbi:phosphoenolpyruvate--protein phosphotransferase [Necropsobacter rosorum]|uniref:phosphoenolpyruvate--protein phosphotransferase n=1 Tax=Necropsobacter rosorum TaxID=908285 RepID=UPI000509F3E6